MNRLAAIWRALPWQSIPLFFGGLFLWRNMLYPLFGDDYAYAFIWDPEHGGNLMDGIGPRERIESLTDIFHSQWIHYFYWGGRTLSMLFIQFFAWQGKYPFNVLNALVFMLLIFVLYRLALGRMAGLREHKFCLLWVILGMYFGIMDVPSSMLWMTGACVYLWTALWTCAFLLPYALSLREEEFWREPPPWAIPLMAIGGLAAGWSEEGVSLATLFILGLMLYFLKGEGRVRTWMKAGAFFAVAGSLFLLLCPGSLQREEFLLVYAPEYYLSADQLFTAEMFYDNFTEGFLPILLWEGFLFLPICICLKNKLADKAARRCILIFLAGSMCVLTVMMFAPEFSIRTGLHSTVFLTVASAAACREILPYLHEKYRAVRAWRWTMRGVGSLCFLYAVACIAATLYVEASFSEQWADRMIYVEEHRNDALIIVPALRIPWDIDAWLGPRSLTKYHLIYGADLESKPEDNRSNIFAQYYGLDKICIDSHEDWAKRRGDRREGDQ